MERLVELVERLLEREARESAHTHFSTCLLSRSSPLCPPPDARSARANASGKTGSDILAKAKYSVISAETADTASAKPA